ncbi:hypothetical protein MBLNU230_g7544t1 [Neophaeotheca triangularis]
MPSIKRPFAYEQDSDSNNSISPIATEELEGPVTKYIQYRDTTPTNDMGPFWCRRPSHRPLRFENRGEYDSHKLSIHSHDCPMLNCHRSFPDSRLLDLHHAECHDPFVAVRRDRGERMYGCFVEGCDKVCRDRVKRKMHLIEKHHYPKNYDFRIMETGLIAGRNSLLRPGVDDDGHRRSSRENLREDDSSSVASRSQEASISPSSSKGSAEPGGGITAFGVRGGITQSGPNNEGQRTTKAKSPDSVSARDVTSEDLPQPQRTGQLRTAARTSPKALGERATTPAKETPASSTVFEFKDGTLKSPRASLARSQSSRATMDEVVDEMAGLGSLRKAMGRANEKSSADVDELAANMTAALRFVPRSVQAKQKEKAKAKAREKEAWMDLS